MELDWSKGPLAEGLRLYEAAEFFAAHEVWEEVWLAAPEPEKTFLQGLIQVTAAFYHMQRNNSLGTELLLQAALGRLQRYPESFGGLAVHSLCGEIRDRLRILEAREEGIKLLPARIVPL